MSAHASARAPTLQHEPSFAGGRYVTRGTLGRGGMAVVYEVTDAATGRRCALKRLVMPQRVDRRAAARTLFEREFLTLAQLGHPSVVRVFDYGLDSDLPYYTMELIAGTDLQARVPLSWRTACATARDLCSVLSLLHSRRLLYRDLNPRNVRTTEDGKTKLIDFGAMAPIGPNRQLIGTPAFCAPEAVDFQPIDARTDLYSLGVMLYLMLTGRLPFQAKDFSQLREQWQLSLPPPSQTVADIPKALEGLVLSLIRVDPALRPTTAAEVIERLGAIAGLQADEQVTIPQAYLSTPSLVGRDAALNAVRERLSTTRAGHGASLVLSGGSGNGRSRLLAACELEAKLHGSCVLRTTDEDLAAGEYTAARALVLQLLDVGAESVMDALSLHAPVLVHVVPELHDRIAGIVPADIDRQRLDQSVQPAMLEIVIEASRRRPLMIAVDDVDRVDEASAALLALLAQKVAQNAVVLVMTLDCTRAARARARSSLELLFRSSSTIVLEALDAHGTLQLLGSLFGEVPNLQTLAHRLHAITSGNPRDLMQLAQHMVDKGALRYRNGAWTIPADVDAMDLPSGMAQALRAQAELLSGASRTLAQTMAQSPGQRFAFEECLVLADLNDRARVMQCLDELLAAGVLRLEGGLFAISQQGWTVALSSTLGVDELQQCNARLADLFALRQDQFRVAQHLLRAGQTQRGLTALVEHAVSSRRRTDEDADAFLALLRSLPDDWLATYEQALQSCKELGRPHAEVHAIRSRLCGLIGATSMNASVHFEALIADLSRSCGLELYAELDPTLPAAQRLQAALAAAQRCHDQAAPAERVADPGTAVGQLARVIIQVSGIIAIGLDHPLVLRMPSLEPLYPLSPALRVVDDLVRGIAARISGRIDQALAIYRSLLERLEQPDRGGLDPAHHVYTVLGVECGVGMLEAAIGLDACLVRASRLAEHPQHHVNGVLMRMLHQQWQGHAHAAQRLKREAELARIQNTQRRVFDGAHLLGELTGYAMAGELTGLKQVVDAVERQAHAHRAWLPVLHYARGEYQRWRGDLVAALVEVEKALSLLEVGRHQIWVWAASAHVRVLLELGRHAQARALGREYLRSAQDHGLGYTCNYIGMPLGLALANLGEHAEGAALAQAGVDEFAAIGATGLNLVLAHETRARVAILSGDRETLDRCLDVLAQARETGTEGLLVNSYDRVRGEARKAGLLDDGRAAVADDEAAAAAQLVRSMLEGCQTIAAKAQAMLDMLVRSTASAGGLLYSVTPTASVLCATVGELVPSSDIEQIVRDFAAAEASLEQTTQAEDQTTDAMRAMTHTTTNRAALRPLLLTHRQSGRETVFGVVVLLREGSFHVPRALVDELSRALLDAGLAEGIVNSPASMPSATRI